MTMNSLALSCRISDCVVNDLIVVSKLFGKYDISEMNSILSSLIPFIVETDHCTTNCPTIRKHLKLLCTVLKLLGNVKYESPERKIDSNQNETVVDVCVHMLREIVDGKDICIPVLCDALHVSLLLFENEDLCVKVAALVEEIKSSLKTCFDSDVIASDLHQSSVDIIKSSINLRILESLLITLTQQNEGFFADHEKRLQILSLLTKDEFLDLLQKLAFCSHDILISQVLLCVIPKLLKLTENKTILYKIWNHLSGFLQSSNCEQALPSHTYLVLCMLADFYIPGNKVCPEYSFSVIKLVEFWKIVQSGLISENSIIRKNALYLLQRAVDYGSDSHVSHFLHVDNPLFRWNFKEEAFCKTWGKIIIILEILEEKQIQLIKPLEPILLSVVESCKQGIIHPSWILAIVQRILRHETISVAKWGVSCLVNLDLCLYVHSEVSYQCLLSALLNALNNSSVYTRKGMSPCLPDIIEELKTYFVNMSQVSLDVCHRFFVSLLKVLTSVSWCPVALFHVVLALSTVPKTPVWDTSNIFMLKHFITDALTTQIVQIRTSIQSFLIAVLIQLSDESKLELTSVAIILGCFTKSKCLQRGTETWSKVVNWLNTFITAQTSYDFVRRSIASVLNGQEVECDKLSLVQLMLLLADAGLISLHSTNLKCNSVGPLLVSVSDYLIECNTRLYACARKQDACLEILIFLLEEGVCEQQNDHVSKYLISLINSALPGIFICIKRRIFAICDLQHFDSFNMYIDMLENLCDKSKLLRGIFKQAEMMQEVCSNFLTCCENATRVSVYSKVKIMICITKYIKSCALESSTEFDIVQTSLFKRQMTFIENISKGSSLNYILDRCKPDEVLTRDLQTLRGRVISDNTFAVWSMLDIYLDFHPVTVLYPTAQRKIPDKVLRDAMEAIEIGGRETLIPVMAVIKKFLAKTKTINSEEVKFMSVCWAGVYELRKSDNFRTSMQQFIQMVFQENVMNKLKMQDHLRVYAQKIFTQGEGIVGLCNLLVCQLQEVALHGNSCIFVNFLDMIMSGVLFGPVHRRDSKIEQETCAYIKFLQNNFSANNTIEGSDAEVRARSVQLLLKWQESLSHRSIITQLAKKLIQYDRETFSKKPRYFNDSYHHRVKHRIMQALLIMEPSLSQEVSETLRIHLVNSLMTKNHQPSVRYQEEWLLIRLLLKNSSACNEVWALLGEAVVKRPGSLCSFIAVILHTACALPLGHGLVTFIDRAIAEVLPWTMAQLFSIRLYAQVAVLKLYEHAKKMEISDIVEKYVIVYQSITFSVQTPGAVKNAQKLLQDFYFNGFHPLHHYSLQTIFYDLPRLSNVTQDEWILPGTFQTCGATEMCVPLYSSNSQLENCMPVTSGKSTGLAVDDEHEWNRDFCNVQKKIVPWKSMVPNPELLLSVSDGVFARKQQVAEGGLVVVASLIDRAPNLGGLSRTCEVFGVSQFVLNSLNYLEDKEFKNLSVTAERWISICEVKLHELPEYLCMMKGEGYTVVGAEQTADSKQLHEMIFPKKTVLLLGNEKGGIPANLLQLLDVCVEIPQQGVVRSLNVHVTGALFIWEYTRQHSGKSNFT